MTSAGLPHRSTRSRRRLLLGGATAVAAAGAAGIGYGSAVEPRWFALRRVTIPVLAAGSRPLRVLHLSDLHLLPRQHTKINWVSRLAELEPDLVVNTGDNIAHPRALGSLLDACSKLLDLPGGFVFGSNDYYRPRLKNPARYLLDRGRDTVLDEPATLPTEELRALLSERGWADLNNARATLSVGGRLIDLAGTDDAYIGRDRYQMVAGPVDPDADLSIGVTHAPYRRVLDAFHADGYPLVLAGHTHGGQLCLPGVGALVTNCDLDTGSAKGLSRHPQRPRPGEPDTMLHVSAGLGTSPFAPVRFCCRPEASLLELIARDAATYSPALVRLG